jgi:hypothetical protein
VDQPWHTIAWEDRIDSPQWHDGNEEPDGHLRVDIDLRSAAEPQLKGVRKVAELRQIRPIEKPQHRFEVANVP